MRPSIDIDVKHSLAIVREVGERLRSLLREETDLPPVLREKMDRLRQRGGEESQRGARLARN